MNAQEIANEADIVVTPLMELLDKKLSTLAQLCERTVLKRLLKELWKMAIHTLEKIIVLPPHSEKNILNLPKANIEDVGKLFSKHTNKLQNLGESSLWFYD